MPKVHITARATVEYSQTIEMSDDTFADYTAAVDRGERDRWFAEFIDPYIDPTDVYDAGEYEDVDVSLVVPTTEGV